MLESLWRDWREQWQASRLLRLGSLGVVLILLLYLVLWLDDELSLYQLEWRQQQSAVAEMRALQQQTHWPDMRQRLEQQHESLLERLWQAETSGLAQASVREALTGLAEQSPLELRLRETRFAEPQSVIEGVSELRGRVLISASEARAPWGWIAQLERYEPRLVIDRLEIRVGSRSSATTTVEYRALVQGIEGEAP